MHSEMMIMYITWWGFIPYDEYAYLWWWCMTMHALCSMKAEQDYLFINCHDEVYNDVYMSRLTILTCNINDQKRMTSSDEKILCAEILEQQCWATFMSRLTRDWWASVMRSCDEKKWWAYWPEIDEQDWPT